MFSNNSGDTKNSQLNGPEFYFVQSISEFSESEIAEHYLISEAQDLVIHVFQSCNIL